MRSTQVPSWKSTTWEDSRDPEKRPRVSVHPGRVARLAPTRSYLPRRPRVVRTHSATKTHIAPVDFGVARLLAMWYVAWGAVPGDAQRARALRKAACDADARLSGAVMEALTVDSLEITWPS